LITIQSAMLVALGFLMACLLALLVAPAFYARAVRLTTQRLRQTMPLSELEIRADKDRVRAEYAIKVHRLESEMEKVRLAAARQLIEISRRDSRINDLEAQLERLKADIEEAQNARRVLEQTVTDRLPRMEQRLNEAKTLLFARDREIADLSQRAEKNAKALLEANTLNAEARSEIERLNAALALRPSKGRRGHNESEAALRSELEALRAKTREQTQLIEQLQSAGARRDDKVAGSEKLAGSRASSDGGLADGPGLPGNEGLAELTRANSELEDQLRNLKSRSHNQSAEIARLEASLKVLTDNIGSGPSTVETGQVRTGVVTPPEQQPQAVISTHQQTFEVRAAAEVPTPAASSEVPPNGTYSGRRESPADSASGRPSLREVRADAPRPAAADPNAGGVETDRREAERRPRLLDRISSLARSS